MILWFTYVQVGVAVLGGLLCVILGLTGRRPSDYTVGALALLELLLVAQVVIAIVAPFRPGASSSSGSTSSRRRFFRQQR